MDKNEKKKFIQSPVAIICYILAALMLFYGCFQAGSTVKQINEYYAGYGMSAKPAEYLTYVLQSLIEPLIHAITLFMAGFILNTVRKLDPKNYRSEEELEEIRRAKREAKEKKQATKEEAKAADGTVIVSGEDFAESLEAELKSDAKASAGRKPRNGQNRSRNTSGRNGGSKNNDGGSRNGDSGSAHKKSDSDSESKNSGRGNSRKSEAGGSEGKSKSGSAKSADKDSAKTADKDGAKSTGRSSSGRGSAARANRKSAPKAADDKDGVDGKASNAGNDAAIKSDEPAAAKTETQVTEKADDADIK